MAQIGFAGAVPYYKIVVDLGFWLEKHIAGVEYLQRLNPHGRDHICATQRHV